MSMPTLRQLQYFCAVVELCHFGKAAERCFVTQSTLSVGIRELESHLGVVLLERTKRKVIPTSLGLKLHDKAQMVLAEAAEFNEMANAERAPLTGVVRLGCIPTISPFLFPAILPAVRSKYPALKLHLIEDQTALCLQRLQNGELDAAILALPYDIGELNSRTFWSENFAAAVPSKHPLARKKSIHSNALPFDELLLLEEGHCLRDHVLSVCQLRGGRQSAFQGTSLYTLLEMVAGNQGITLVPEMALHAELMRQESITFLPLDDPGPHRQISLVWRPTLPRKQDMELLAESMGHQLESFWSESAVQR